MRVVPEIIKRFSDWVNQQVVVDFPDVESGFADQDVENIAWLRINTKQTISGIKLWDTGDYYIEVLTLADEDPALAEFGKLPEQAILSDAFKVLFDKISEIESA